MNANDLTTIDQVCAFMSGTQRVVFEVAGDKQGRYDWVRRTLVKFDYSGCGKADRGVLISYLMKVSSYSRAQVKRLIKRYRETGRLTPRQRTVRGFTRRYTKVDIRLLAAMDERHNTPNGLTLKKLCERAYAVFGQADYERLAGISVSHLYNLRQSQTYRRQRHTIEKTRPVTRDIGARRKPQSDGQPGTIRIDTVHQGDLDGEKGVYHINAVDEVTQFEVVVSVEKSVNTISSRPWHTCWRASRSSSGGSTPTTARNTSTGGSPGCWRNCVSSSPSPAPGTATTTPWWNARTVMSCASCSAMPISRNAGPACSMTFIASTSIPTSTIIGPVCSHKPSLTRPGNNASVILTNP